MFFVRGRAERCAQVVIELVMLFRAVWESLGLPNRLPGMQRRRRSLGKLYARRLGLQLAIALTHPETARDPERALLEKLLADLAAALGELELEIADVSAEHERVRRPP